MEGKGLDLMTSFLTIAISVKNAHGTNAKNALGLNGSLKKSDSTAVVMKSLLWTRNRKIKGEHHGPKRQRDQHCPMSRTSMSPA
jgi:hypothetical protein